jgi:hypothetical protein
VRAASRLEVVDELALLAAGAEPAALDDAAARRMIDRAIAARGHAPAPIVASPWLARVAWPLAALAMAVVVWLVARRAPDAEPIRVALPTGDHLVGTAGTRFELERVEPADRRVRLRDGAMLFDVAHVVPSQRFAVATDRVVVVATGTVFSVAAGAGTRVHVYEGSVTVTADGHDHALAAGETWSEGGTSDEPAAVVEAAREAVDARASTNEHTAASDHGESTRGHAPNAEPAPSSAANDPTPVAVRSTDHDGHGDASFVPDDRNRSTRETGAATSPVATASSTDRNDSTRDHGATSSNDRDTPARDGSSVRSSGEHASSDSAARLARARADVAAGEFRSALAAFDREPAPNGAWLLVAADARRGLGDVPAAADTYARAAAALTGPERAEAMYTAAYLRFHDLHDATGALAALGDDSGPLEERALALRVQILVALHRGDDARDAARRYLARFPRGDLAGFARSTAREP